MEKEATGPTNHPSSMYGSGCCNYIPCGIWRKCRKKPLKSETTLTLEYKGNEITSGYFDFNYSEDEGATILPSAHSERQEWFVDAALNLALWLEFPDDELVGLFKTLL